MPVVVQVRQLRAGLGEGANESTVPGIQGRGHLKSEIKKNCILLKCCD